MTGKKTGDDAGPKPGAERKSRIFGCMAGTITIMPGVDLTAPHDDIWHALEGVLTSQELDEKRS
jgi:hypothetical protein